MTMRRKRILLLAALVTAVVGLFYWGCSKSTKDEVLASFHKTANERNCSEEYEQIANREYFYSVPSAICACDSFLQRFQYQQCAYSEDVRSMRESFQKMGEFFNHNYYSYEQFKTEAHYQTQHFANSPHRVVRQTWSRLLHEEDSCRLRAALMSLTAHDFKVYLHDYAQQLCQERYGKGLFSMRMKGLELTHITNPSPVEGMPAVECTAEFDIHLEGALGLGLRTRTDKVTVSGQLMYSPDGRLIFRKVSCSTQ